MVLSRPSPNSSKHPAGLVQALKKIQANKLQKKEAGEGWGESKLVSRCFINTVKPVRTELREEGRQERGGQRPPETPL